MIWNGGKAIGGSGLMISLSLFVVVSCIVDDRIDLVLSRSSRDRLLS